MIRDDIIAQARARQGTPYRLDPPPDGVHTLDCSLYVVQVLAAAGVPLPVGVRTAEQIRRVCRPIPFSEVRPGDLLFFEKTYDVREAPWVDGKVASHVGISLGAGTRRMWDANDGRGSVGITDISTDYWQEHVFEARRPPGLADDGPVAPEAGPLGIDVSNWQGTIDWDAVKNHGVTFAFAKASEGLSYVDPYIGRNWSEMKRVGIVRGAYHYGRPDRTSPEEEAAYFWAVVQPFGVEPGDMLALDLETGSGYLGDWALRFLRRLEALAGFKPLVYTSPSFVADHGLAREPKLGGYPLWLAAWGQQLPAAPAPWSAVAFWQFTDAGSVAGIAGNVDLDRFVGSGGIASFGKPAAAAPTPSFAGPGDVGPGILEMMGQDGTEPALPSTFLPLGRSPAVVEECLGLNGTVYRWHIPSGRRWRYPAA